MCDVKLRNMNEYPRNLRLMGILYRLPFVLSIFFSFSCFDIVHKINIQKIDVVGQLHIILPRKMFGQDISEGNGVTSMNATLDELKKKPGIEIMKTFSIQQNSTESNYILTFIYSGVLRSNWKYSSPDKKDPSPFLIPYIDSKDQMLFVVHSLPDKLPNESIDSEFGQAMLGQFTYKLNIQSDRKFQKALLYKFNENGEVKKTEIPRLGLENDSLYILPIDCMNGNCVLVLSQEKKVDLKESDRIASTIKTKLNENFKKLQRLKDALDKNELNEKEKNNDKNSDKKSVTNDETDT